MRYYLIFLITIFVSGCISSPVHQTGTSNTPISGQEETQPVTAEDVLREPNPLSIPALREKEFNGDDLTLVSVLAETALYTRYRISYTSGELTISGIMNVPRGEGPFPVLILNHGYIDPEIYTNGRGLKREQDYLAKEGYVVIHPDYRGHAFSDDPDEDTLAMRFGYNEDVVNAVYAARRSDIPEIDATRVGMLGHSMGGGITLAIITALPDLVDAAVLFAPVSGDYRDSYERWLKERPGVPSEIAEKYGTPDENSVFWDELAAETYYTDIQVPVVFHHGTDDDDVPLSWSDNSVQLLKDAGVDVTYYIYNGEPHEFINAWPTVMQRTTDFFDQYLK